MLDRRRRDHDNGNGKCQECEISNTKKREEISMFSNLFSYFALSSLLIQLSSTFVNINYIIKTFFLLLLLLFHSNLSRRRIVVFQINFNRIQIDWHKYKNVKRDFNGLDFQNSKREREREGEKEILDNLKK